MGLIKAAIGAVGGTMADQWKEFFYCEALPKEVRSRPEDALPITEVMIISLPAGLELQ